MRGQAKSGLSEATSAQRLPIVACEQTLAQLVGRRHCILTGSGTGALKLACSAVDPSRPKIVLPAMVCLAAVLAVYYARRTPVFADVLEQNATLDPLAMDKLLRIDPQIGAVVPVHLYGFPSDMTRIRNIAAKYGIMVIEDVAQAFGGQHENGEPLGKMGDCCILSFGHTKIIDIGIGGAFLTDDDRIAEHVRQMSERLPEPSDNRAFLAKVYRTLFYSIWEGSEVDQRFHLLWDGFPQLFEDLHIHRVRSADAGSLLNALARIDDETKRRRQLAAVYAEELHGVGKVSFFQPSSPYAPWRFCLRVDSDARAAVLENIRQAGHDASRWYPNVANWVEPGRRQGAAAFPIANRLEKEVVNLWLAEGYSGERVRAVTDVIKAALS